MGRLLDAYMFEFADINIVTTRARFNMSGYIPLKIHLLNILDGTGEITSLTLIIGYLTELNHDDTSHPQMI